MFKLTAYKCLQISHVCSRHVFKRCLKSYQALLEAIGSSCSSGQEAVANAEISVAILIARVGAQDPSAIPSICRGKMVA